jgi:hypothetical protein
MMSELAPAVSALDRLYDEIAAPNYERGINKKGKATKAFVPGHRERIRDELIAWGDELERVLRLHYPREAVHAFMVVREGFLVLSQDWLLAYAGRLRECIREIRDDG